MACRQVQDLLGGKRIFELRDIGDRRPAKRLGSGVGRFGFLELAAGLEDQRPAAVEVGLPGSAVDRVHPFFLPG